MGYRLLNEVEEVHGKPEEILCRAAQIRSRDVNLCLVNKRHRLSYRSRLSTHQADPVKKVADAMDHIL